MPRGVRSRPTFAILRRRLKPDADSRRRTLKLFAASWDHSLGTEGLDLVVIGPVGGAWSAELTWSRDTDRKRNDVVHSSDTLKCVRPTQEDALDALAQLVNAREERFGLAQKRTRK